MYSIEKIACEILMDQGFPQDQEGTFSQINVKPKECTFYFDQTVRIGNVQTD